MNNVLFKLRRAMIGNHSVLLNASIRAEAAELAERLLAMLSSFVQHIDASGSPRTITSIDQWVSNTENGLNRFKLIQEIFVKTITLKYQLPLSSCYYELHYPTPSEGHLIEDSEEEPGAQVEFYFAPAILEYEPEMFEERKNGIISLFGEQKFVRVTEAERKQARVVSKAVARFYE